MSIDARVVSITMNENGSGRLNLIDRPKRPSGPGGCAGKTCLHFERAPAEVTALCGLCIWSAGHDRADVMLGELSIGTCVGMRGIAFKGEKHFNQAVQRYHHYFQTKPKPPSV